MSEVVMYIVVNKDINMSKGKTSAQVAHVAVMASHLGSSVDPGSWLLWYGGSFTKICLEGKTSILENLMEMYCDTVCSVEDEGRTEIAKGSLTALAFIPMPKDERPKELKRLSLLRG